MPKSPSGVEPKKLLLDGQQRLTSLTQALTGGGIVSTMDARGKKLTRKYYVDIAVALEGEDRIDDAVLSLPGDGVVRSNFGKDIELDVSTPEREREHGYFPLNLLFVARTCSHGCSSCTDIERAKAFNDASHSSRRGPTTSRRSSSTPSTSKSAVATVFEKVNTGGLPSTSSSC